MEHAARHGRDQSRLPAGRGGFRRPADAEEGLGRLAAGWSSRAQRSNLAPATRFAEIASSLAPRNDSGNQRLHLALSGRSDAGMGRGIAPARRAGVDLCLRFVDVEPGDAVRRAAPGAVARLSPQPPSLFARLSRPAGAARAWARARP